MVSTHFTQPVWRAPSLRSRHQPRAVAAPMNPRPPRPIPAPLPVQPILVARPSLSPPRVRSRPPTRHRRRSRAATTLPPLPLVWWLVSSVWPLWLVLHSSSIAPRSRTLRVDSVARPVDMAVTRSHPPCRTPVSMETTWPSAVRATAASTMIMTFLAESCRSVFEFLSICYVGRCTNVISGHQP